MPNPYESDTYLSEYLLFHYGKPKDLCAWRFAPKGAFDFHRRIVRGLVRPVRRKGSRALDLGCAVGRLSFELSRHFDEVIGVDFSKNFVNAARNMARKRSASFTVCEEGDIAGRRTVRLHPGIRAQNVRFETGDAHRLRRDIGSFDLVVMANLICRLRNPRQCLRRLSKLVRPGGQLVITTPCSWLEGYVPKRNRLACPGRTTLDALRKILAPHFQLVKRRDLPFLIREHRRKYQWIVAEATAWRRKP